MAVATLRHNSTFLSSNTSSNAASGNTNSRSSGAAEILHTQLQQGGHNIAAPNHSQTSGIWDLANSADMSYELAAAGTGKELWKNEKYFHFSFTFKISRIEYKK